ncbi:ATP-binding protein [Paracidovorax anthurii]|uniref:ATP-dependent DNA helicase RecG n=1 Tax=Paracidovorax anthurii TaxID=78229 RepID=A0A328Z4J7_9BURK|nr:ATP-binding protein [Paracidovorax anthurii]RAR80363.1 ATP-dependent DNA helicase RecG [Paracidovorax anthurii]
MRLTDEQLLVLLSDLESDRAERKESFKGDAPEKVRQAVCAFANDLPGHGQPGVVFIGAKDGDGALTGLEITDQLLLALADIRSDGNILPFPSMTVEKRRLGDKDVVVMTVMPAEAPPVKYKGRICIRTGPRHGIANAQDERLLNERRRHGDLPFDLQPVSFASLADLSRSAFETEYLPGAFAPDVLEANHRTYEERLSACRMIDSVASPLPTVLGAMVIGTRPRDLIPCSYVQFLRIDGVELDDPIVDEAVIDGRLGEIIGRLDDKLRAHIATRVDVASGDVERRRADYPLAALQQLLRNAVMHRTYEATNAPIRVTWFNDRIEIVSPGGPYGIVNAGNFGQPGITDYRNPHLAEALKVLGYVQRFGVGIATARRLLADNGNPLPEFEVRATHVLVIVRRPA